MVNDCGLLINPKWPLIGASPDRLLSCECCGKGTLEIKCPYCHTRGESIPSAASSDKTFFLYTASDGSHHLDHSHAYYYQLQTQLFVSDFNQCDFVFARLLMERPVRSLNIFRKMKNFGVNVSLK